MLLLITLHDSQADNNLPYSSRKDQKARLINNTLST